MSRVEENKNVTSIIEDDSITGDFEHVIAWELTNMNRLLIDISKSLAVIADKHINGKEQE